jgi:hypothetical protein
MWIMKNQVKPKGKPKGTLIDVLSKAHGKGEDVNIHNAVAMTTEKEKPVKVSLDLKPTTDQKVQQAIFWGRMSGRSEVIEYALEEYFIKHEDLLKPLPPKKYGK